MEKSCERGKMKKNLNDMSLEELWQLFPIFLTEHQSCWAEWYTEEEALLSNLLSDYEVIRICHIGSTAIDHIWAKPTIDILLEVSYECDMEMDNIKAKLEHNGYTCMNQTDNRISFNKGYKLDGFAEKVFHIHVRFQGDHDELYFRDYLIEHPEIAHEYEKMKLKLWKKYEHDRDGYSYAKADFVLKWTQEAKRLYKDRYEIN